MTVREDNRDLRLLIEAVVSDMAEYLEETRRDGVDPPDYSKDDIERCRQVLLSHAEQVANATDQRQGLAAVQRTVEALNKVNDDAGGELIETSQREMICDFIIRSGAARGFNRNDEDVTELWREW